MSLARLLISCPDRPGIVAAVGRFLCDRGANIVASAQHTTDPADGTFFMRVEFVVNGEECLRPSLEAAFQRTVAASFRMRWRMAYATDRKRLGILVSKHDHCLLDIVWRWRRGELDADIVGVASNHPDLEEDVENFGLAYKHIPMDPSRRHAEQSIFELFDGNVDFLVLARYMQILTGEFLLRINVPVINIHHAFLPSFAGGNPYGQALERGVKIIGATAHYVTEELDAGPIIEQDVERVTHSHDLGELTRIGRDVERVVLARAVKWHIEDRVIVHGNKTFVFS